MKTKLHSHTPLNAASALRGGSTRGGQKKAPVHLESPWRQPGQALRRDRSPVSGGSHVHGMLLRNAGIEPDRTIKSASVEAVKLNDAARRLYTMMLAQAPSPYTSLERSMAYSMKAAAAAVPLELIETLRAFVTDPLAKGALLIRGLPVDHQLPDTPWDGGRAVEKTTFVSEAVLLGLTQFLGHPFGFTALKGGEIVHNICPVRGSEGSQSNEGSERDFDFHIESAFSELRADHLALFCLRSDHGGEAKTTLLSAQRAYERLAPEVQVELRKPHFVTVAPESWKALHAEGKSSAPRPVVLGPEGMIELCANLQSTRGTTPEAQAALEALGNVLRDPSLEEYVRLRPGDLLLVDNRKALHGRSVFKPRYDGQDRWLQRVYTSGDLWEGRSETAPSPRVRDRY